MNGVRSIFRRKGYLLTALTAAVLLAASSGTALAQVTITGPETVTEGDAATYAVAIKGYIQPAAAAGNAVVTLMTTAVDESTATDGEANDLSQNALTFTVAVPMGPADSDTAVARAFSATGVIRLQTLDDLDAEDEDFTVAFSVTSTLTVAEEAGTAIDVAGGDDAPPGELTIEDDETQEYNLTLNANQDPKEGGGPIMATLTANPAHVNGSAMLSVQLDVPLTIASISAPVDAPVVPVINMGNRSEGITITLGGNDKNRDEDTITLSAYSGTAGNSTLEDSLSIDVEDKDALPAVAMMVTDKDGKVLDPQPTSVAEGESIYVAVMPVNDKGKAIDAAEKLTVALTPTGTADGADYALVGAFTIDEDDDSSDPVELEVRADEDVGTDTLMFDAVVTGDAENGPGTLASPGVLSLTIEDETAKKIAPRSQDEAYPKITDAIEAGAGEEGLNPGETVTIMTGDLFTVMDGYTASYGVSVDGDSVSGSSSGDSITVDAKSAGESKVTVTGTARMDSSSFIPAQTVSNVAEITFAVMVVDTELVVTVSADPMEIDEGGTSTITAMATRAITAGDDGVEIALTVVGDGELDADSIMIAIGDMSGSAMLTSTEDDDTVDGTVTVVATGDGITGGTTQVEIAVADNDDADNAIEAKPQGEAYPVITGVIGAAGGADGLNPGESFSLMASDLFAVMDGYTASYSVSVDGDAATASVSGDSVDVTAAAAGEAKVTITGAAKTASSSFEASQDATNVASITFPVTVVDVALVVMLEMPAGVMDGNIVEGESYEIMVSANRMVSEDTEVMIMRDRAASDADDSDFTVSSATIMAGYDSATAELMVTEDMMPDGGTDDNMGESLVLYGMAGDMETNSLTFTIWDQAVPALPLFGQMLLALFLMLGGARLYRRRQQG